MTDNMISLLDTVRTFIAENGYPPTVRELAQLRGLSTAGVHLQLKQLRELGFVDWKDGKGRTLRVTS
jgi:repressor LexA